MATLTYKNGYVLDLGAVTSFSFRMHPGDAEFFHIHAKGSGIVESVWKKKQMHQAARDTSDFNLYVIDQGKNVKIDLDTGRVVPDE